MRPSLCLPAHPTPFAALRPPPTHLVPAVHVVLHQRVQAEGGPEGARGAARSQAGRQRRWVGLGGMPLREGAVRGPASGQAAQGRRGSASKGGKGGRAFRLKASPQRVRCPHTRTGSSSAQSGPLAAPAPARAPRQSAPRPRPPESSTSPAPPRLQQQGGGRRQGRCSELKARPVARAARGGRAPTHAHAPPRPPCGRPKTLRPPASWCTPPLRAAASSQPRHPPSRPRTGV